MNKSFLFLFILFCFSKLHGQDTTIQWQRTSTDIGASDGYLTCITTPPSGNYISAGWWEGGDYLVELNKQGRQIWSSNYWPAGQHHRIFSIIPLGNGYVYTGNEDNYPYYGNTEDVYIGKIDTGGKNIWVHTYAGTSTDEANAIIQTMDGKYAIAGMTSSSDGNFKNKNNGRGDAFIMKLDTAGKMLWEKTFGGDSLDEATTLVQTPDSGYLLVGNTRSADSNLSFRHGGMDIWVLKLNKNGIQQWEKTYGGTGDEDAKSIIRASDGGFVIFGTTTSSDHDISQLHGNADIWIFKIDIKGKLIWEKTFGGSDEERAGSIVTTNDSSYVFIGSTLSNDGDVKINKGSIDVWVVKIKDSTLIWEKTYGGNSDEVGTGIVYTNNGLAFSAHSNSSGNGDLAGDDLTGSEGTPWMVKLNASITTGMENDINYQSSGFALFPNPANDVLHVKFDNAGIYIRPVIKITDIFGREIKAPLVISKSNELIMDISGFASGVYIISFQEKEMMWEQKIIKE